jgi:hypothetical protein
MSPETKLKALDKLARLHVKIAYPEKWRDYSALEVRPDDLFGDVQAVRKFAWLRQVNRLNSPVDRDDWYMSPQTVNASYNASLNEMVFPAGILQPPFFDPAADPAVNSGGIGAVIGHEMRCERDVTTGQQRCRSRPMRDWLFPRAGAVPVLMICNIGGPPWRRPRKPPNLSHCPREIVPGVGGGGRYECTRRNFGEVLRSRYRRRRGLCDRHLRARLAVRRTHPNRRQAIDMQGPLGRPPGHTCQYRVPRCRRDAGCGITGKTVGARA